MKKKIFLTLITIIISTFIFTMEVQADPIMYLYCDYDNRCEEDGFWENLGEATLGILTGGAYLGWDCMPTYNNIFRVTDNDGNSHFVVLPSDPSGEGLGVLDDKCWLAGDLSNLGNSCSEKNRYTEVPNEIISGGTCPIAIRTTSTLYDGNLLSVGPFGPITLVAVGKNNPTKQSTLGSEYQYVIYSFADGDGKERIMAEGYNNKGEYCFVGADYVTPLSDEIAYHQVSLIINVEKPYFNVSNDFDVLLVAGNGSSVSGYSSCKGKNKEKCEKENNFKILAASSGEGYSNLKTSISDWIQSEESQFAVFTDIMNLVDDNDFMSTLSSIKENVNEGTEYSFGDVDINEFIDKLDDGYYALEKAFSAEFSDCGYEGSETNIQSSITSCAVYSDLLGIRHIVELAEENDSEHMLNENYIIEALYKDAGVLAEEALKELGYPAELLGVSDKLTEYTELMYFAIAYLNSKAIELGLNVTEIDEIYKKYMALVDSQGLNIYPVVDCETLLSEDVINKIRSYLNIIKIAVPIIVIGLGIIDFTKAIFASEEDMKKVQKQFIKRIMIAILIFLTPTLINLLLSLANKVWTVISPDTCGIF